MGMMIVLIKQKTLPITIMDASTVDVTDTGKEEKKPRFQLCFSVKDTITTRADTLRATYKLWGISLPIITPKFYTPKSNELTDEDEREVEETVKKLVMIESLGPREKYKEPILESHRYGWFHESFVERHPDLDRVHFPRSTSDMVRIQNLFAQFKSKIGDRCE